MFHNMRGFKPMTNKCCTNTYNNPTGIEYTHVKTAKNISESN